MWLIPTYHRYHRYHKYASHKKGIKLSRSFQEGVKHEKLLTRHDGRRPVAKSHLNDSGDLNMRVYCSDNLQIIA